MRKIFFSLIIPVLFLISCQETGTVQVENRVSNARLENINFGDIPITYSLMPGQKSSKVTVTDSKEKFMKTGQVEFIMARDGKRVYLKTKAEYLLDYDEDLFIIISDTTEVVNPLVKK